jgi:hypothetical protein
VTRQGPPNIKSNAGVEPRKKRSLPATSLSFNCWPVVPNCPAWFETPHNDVGSSPTRDLANPGVFFLQNRLL